MSNSLDPDQDRHSVDPDLGPNCLQIKVISKRQKSLLARKGLKFKHLLSHRKKLKPTDPCHVFVVCEHIRLNPAYSATETS